MQSWITTHVLISSIFILVDSEAELIGYLIYHGCKCTKTGFCNSKISPSMLVHIQIATRWLKNPMLVGRSDILNWMDEANMIDYLVEHLDVIRLYEQCSSKDHLILVISIPNDIGITVIRINSKAKFGFPLTIYHLLI